MLRLLRFETELGETESPRTSEAALIVAQGPELE